MKRFNSYFFLITLLVILKQGTAQIDTAWSRAFESGAWDESQAISSDPAGNVYVTGYSYVWHTSCDMVTLKYNANGDLLWSKTYSHSPAGWEEGKLISWHNGYIYVAGYTAQGISTALGRFAIIKYTEDGDTVWTYLENETYEGTPTSMRFDSENNVLIAGYDGNTSSDCITLKLDSAGKRSWLSKYSNSGPNDVDKIWDMCLDDSDNVYVTGMSDDTTNFYLDILTIKYKPDGDTAWVRRFNGPSNYYDQGWKLCYDEQGFIYVGGSTSTSGAPWNDFAILKYSTSGALIWSKFYNNAYNSFDQFTGLEIDNSGYLYAMGTGSKTNNTQSNFIELVKYNPEGDTVWTSMLDLPSSDNGEEMTIDSNANLYITGATINTNGQGFNGLTCKFDSSGELKWYVEYNGKLNNEDEFYDLTLDQNNDLIVAGRTKNDTTVMDYITVKYRNSLAGIQPIESGNPTMQMSCYPNPASGSVLINYYLPENQKVSFSIYDREGKEVLCRNLGKQNAGNHNMPLSISDFNNGIYVCILESENARDHYKLVVVK